MEKLIILTKTTVMNNNPKPGDIGVYTLRGMSMEVELRSPINLGDFFSHVMDARGSYFHVNKANVNWSQRLEVVDKPIILDPNIDWHNDLDQESMKAGYRPLVKGEDKQIGDQFFDTDWFTINRVGGQTYYGSKYRTKRPLSDALEQKREKLVAKIEELEKEAYALRKELNNL